MKLAAPERITTDVLVIGGGGAGLRAAIEARKRGADVIVVTKSRSGYGSNTAISGSAMAVALGERSSDTPDIQLADTVAAGRLLNHREVVKTMVIGAPPEIDFLASVGVELEKGEYGLRVTSAPGHTNPRLVHSMGHIGTDITVPLFEHAVSLGVRFLDHTLVTRLLTADDCAGAMALSKDGRIIDIHSSATILACGGLGQVFLRTDNTADSTGDGYALAYHSGASLADMEFVQFYPTAFGKRGARGISYEVFVYRSGATLRNANGEDVIERHALGSGAKMTRDQLSRSMMLEIGESRGIGEQLELDLSTVPVHLRERIRPFLPKYTPCDAKLPVSPTTHYMMGGVKVDARGRTAVTGLFAAGEVASGAHGANRLVGNSLPEALVLGAVAGKAAAGQTPEPAVQSASVSLEMDRLAALGREEGTPVKELVGDLKRLMWEQVGVLRTAAGLAGALMKIDALKREVPAASVQNTSDLWSLIEFDNMLLVSEMICRSALHRTESRGSHFRCDYPLEQDGQWLKHITVARRGNEMMLADEHLERAAIG